MGTGPPIATLLAAVLAAAGLAAACGSGSASGAAEAVVHPAGTVFVVDGQPILESEVDAWVPTIRRLYPADTIPSLRRYALTNVVLHRTATRTIDPKRREEQRLRAESARERLRAGHTGDVEGGEYVERFGQFSHVGLDVWGLAHDLPVGEWSEVYESIGGWVVFRVLERPEPGEEWDVHTQIKIEAHYFLWVDLEGRDDVIQDAIDQAEIEIVDPEWEQILPEYYRHERKR